MNKYVSRLHNTRSFLLETVKDISLEKMNYIPDGFSNNILWNIGHIIAAQQGICYVRSGNPTTVKEQFILSFKNGSKPNGAYDEATLAEVKDLLFSTLEKLDEDLANNIFANYQPWKTRYGVEINNIQDAIEFMSYHEGLHMGFILALKRLVQ